MHTNEIRRRWGRASALAAAVLGLASAAISGYWAAGGTALLDTIGGQIEQWGRQPDGAVTAALWAIAILKAGVALAAPVIAGIPRSLPLWTRSRVPRLLSWVAACVLTGYGAVLTTAGLLVLTSVIPSEAPSDPKALAWHAYLWDPWFLLWGLAFGSCLLLTRPARTA